MILLFTPPFLRDFLMRRQNQIPAWVGHEITDDGRFYVNGFHSLIAMQIDGHRKPWGSLRKG
jgi:hypothetical protein